MTYQIVYSSCDSHAMSADNLEKILVDAREGNTKRGITGALVHIENVFFQILEGEEAVVRELMDNISQDTRHTNIKVFYEATVDEPVFASWSMACVTPDQEEINSWISLDGAETIDKVLEHIHDNPNNTPGFMLRILETLAD